MQTNLGTHWNDTLVAQFQANSLHAALTVLRTFEELKETRFRLKLWPWCSNYIRVLGSLAATGGYLKFNPIWAMLILISSIIIFLFFDSHWLCKPRSQLTALPSITQHWFVLPKQIAIKRPDAAEFIIIISSYLSSTFQNQSYRALYKDSKRNENIKHPGHKIRSQGGKIKAVTTILRHGDSFLKNSKAFIEIQ